MIRILQCQRCGCEGWVVRLAVWFSVHAHMISSCQHGLAHRAFETPLVPDLIQQLQLIKVSKDFFATLTTNISFDLDNDGTGSGWFGSGNRRTRFDGCRFLAFHCAIRNVFFWEILIRTNHCVAIATFQTTRVNKSSTVHSFHHLSVNYFPTQLTVGSKERIEIFLTIHASILSEKVLVS